MSMIISPYRYGYPNYLGNVPTVFSTLVTTHLCNFPASNAGDRLMMQMAIPSSTVTLTIPVGWSPRVNTAQTGARLCMMEKISAGGAAGTVDIVTGTAIRMVSLCHRIEAGTFLASEPTDFATPTTGTTNLPDPPNLSVAVAWSQDVLWMALYGGVSPGTTTVFPFLDGQTTVETSGATANDIQIASCWRKHTATALNPTAFTRQNAARWIATTLATRRA